MEYLLLTIGAVVAVVMIRGGYQRVARWQRSKRFRGAIESVDAVQNALANLAEGKD